jgi:biopolymer transport protein ExbD
MASWDFEGDEGGPIAAINIVPFVDVVLVLLVIFMLTSAHLVRASIGVELPSAANAGSAVPATINLSLDAQGALALDGQAVDWAEAGRRVRAARQREPKLQAALGADRGVPYGRVIALIDWVKQNGVETFALQVERAPAPADPSAAP